MGVDKGVAMDVWRAAFGDARAAKDCFGHTMVREDYGNYELLRQTTAGGQANFGWDIDHIRPKSDYKEKTGDESGADFWGNYEPESHDCNQQKGDGFPQFWVDGVRYRVERFGTPNGPAYGIVNDETGERVDWKGRK